MNPQIFVGGYAEEFSKRNFRSNLNLFYDVSGGQMMFVESSKGRRYGLEEDSPAFKVGFKPINLEDVGAH